MGQHIINLSWVISLLLIFLLASCKVGSIKETDGSKQVLSEKCQTGLVYFDSIDDSIFEGFDSPYEEFNSSGAEVEILIRSLGRDSELARFIKISDKSFKLIIYNTDSFSSEKIIESSPLSLKENKRDYHFSCNMNSSDLGTHIYIVKSKGVVVNRIWVDNGDFWDLPKSEIANYRELEKLLQFYP